VAFFVWKYGFILQIKNDTLWCSNSPRNKSRPLPYFTKASRIRTKDGLGIAEGTDEATSAIPDQHMPQWRATRAAMVPAFVWISRGRHRQGAEGPHGVEMKTHR
jgi:hypothetical protein